MLRRHFPRRTLDTNNARCPQCDARIPSESINITEGVALCSG